MSVPLKRLIWLPLALTTITNAGQFVVNGSFSTNNFPANTCVGGTSSCNVEFDPNYNSGATANIVTGWSATGYSIYFIAGKQTTQSAIGQWTNSTTGAGSEMLATSAAGKLSPNGGNFVGLDADPTINSSISQTLTGLNVGTLYTVSFYWAASQLQSRTGATNEQVNVQVFNGSNYALNFLTGVVYNPSAGFTQDTTTNQWFKVSVNFVANNSTQTLKFLAKSTSTCLPPMVLLDGISVQNAPEPATVAMMGIGVGLIGIAAARRRRSKL